MSKSHPGNNLRNTSKVDSIQKLQANLFVTFHIILSDVAVLMQDLLHAAESDSC